MDYFRQGIATPRRGLVSLTPEGRERAESDHEGMEPDWKVLWDLNASGPSKVEDIARRTRMDSTFVRSLLKRLEEDGLVTRGKRG